LGTPWAPIVEIDAHGIIGKSTQKKLKQQLPPEGGICHVEQGS
jgi:hypothetical protein